MVDYVTRWEEKVQTMLNLLKKCNLNLELEAQIEQDILTDKHYSIKDFKVFLKRLKSNPNNLKVDKNKLTNFVG